MSRVSTLIGRIETNESLDRLIQLIRPSVERAVGTGRRRNTLTGAWLGHPAHPPAVAVPTGCWLAAGVLDAAGGTNARSAARLLIGLGVVAAAPAAATGGADWLDTDGAERRIGTVHAVGNVTATLLYAGSWLARGRNRHRLGVGLGAAGAAVMAGAGYLGGHLAYVRGVGVNTTAFESGPTEWTRLDLSGQLPGPRPVAGVANGVVLVVVIDPDEASINVLEDRCTHRGGPLHEGEVVGNCLVCPWHGSKFDVASGEVRQGPASVAQPAYEVRHAGSDPARELEVRRAEAGGLRKNPITAARLADEIR